MSRSTKVGSRREIGSAIERTYRLDDAVEVTPGMLLEITGVADDGTPIVGPQSADGGNVSVRIAVEKMTGSTTEREQPKDVDYTEANDEVRAYVLRPGEGDENGIGQADIDELDYVVSNGDGTFRAFDDDPGTDTEGGKLAVALEGVAEAGDRFEYEVI